MSAIAEAAPVTSAPQSHRLLEVDPNRFAALTEQRQRVAEALVRFNAANEDAKAKKKIYEAARSTFEREFDRFVANINGEDLPLFNQSELLDRAKADPVVVKLVDRLLGAGHDVNAILVAGYTEDERAEAAAYLDARDAWDEAGKTGSGHGADALQPQPPAFLTPQPLTPIEIADLAQRLKDEEFALTTDQIATLTHAQIAEVRDWLTRCAEVKQAKGDAVTLDDLPPAPDCVVNAAAENGEEESDPDVH